NQRHERRYHEDDLALGEMEAVEPDALGHRRARREGQDDAQPHQRQERRQEPAIHRPPPDRNRAPVQTTCHQRAPLMSVIPLRAPTAVLKASPRTSKFLNWSKLAQAGDSSTAASPPPSRTASRAACSTATARVPEIS